MELGRRGQPTLLTSGGRRATMATCVGGVAQRKLDVDGNGLLRLNRGHQRGSWPPAKLLAWSIWHERRHTGVEVSFTRRLGF
jgi:hypothetical protein